MKRAALFACLFALTSPAFAQDADTAGPITNQVERDAIAQRVRGGASCTGCDLFQIDLSYQNIAGRNFTGSRIRQADLTIAIADRTDFTGANLNEAQLVGAYFGVSQFTGARLRGANLSGADLSNARGLTQDQLNTACGDVTTALPQGLTVPIC